MKDFREKTENENFEQCHNAEKCEIGTLQDFLSSFLLQTIKKLKEDPLVQISEKSHSAEKNLP